MPERLRREKAVTDGLDGRMMRSWCSDTDTRTFYVRLGHKRRRQWERREVRRQTEGAA